MIDFQNLQTLAIKASLAATEVLKKYYHRQDELTIETKDNNTPVTFVDKTAEDDIRAVLGETGIPVIGEEYQSLAYEVRQQWEYTWIVDPLDGTREYLNKTGEFCVSIALCFKGEPILGVIAAPEIPFIAFGGSAINQVSIFEGDYTELSAKTILEVSEPLVFTPENKKQFTLLVSRSMFDKHTQNVVENLKKKKEDLIIRHLGSAIKFVEILKGGASAYFRPGPSFEWDTAGGHALVKHFGLDVKQIKNHTELQYNKEDLMNPYFYCSVKPLPID
jgi:3'(2'), 5'-bisphosphate nucleotidase